MKRQVYGLVYSVIIFIFSYGSVFAQKIVVDGSVVDEASGETLIGVHVVVKGTVTGTIANLEGKFKLTVSSLPVTLVISSIGYEKQEIEVTTDNTNNLEIKLKESVILGQEIIVSASRVEESILSSPVTVQKLDILDIRNSASTDFYDALKNLNGVDVSAQSLTFKSINPRGFNSNGNTRFVQLIDGIDNEAPGLNFSVGNAVGINELDLESLELLSGPASALYGPNALQGLLLLKSKSPFEYQGLSIYSKLGVNHIGSDTDEPASLYHDYAIRYAKAFNNKFAFKIAMSYITALDFVADDQRHLSAILGVDDRGTITRASRTYNGTNVYGDFDFNFGAIINSPDVAPFASLLPTGADGSFTPTGYTESSFVDNRTSSFKGNVALHWRINDKLELLGQYNYGFGSSVYTANDRFILDNFLLNSGKLELRGTNFYVRGYITAENAGDTYAANTVASIINQNRYLPFYLNTFVGARALGLNIDQAHAQARIAADADQAANYAAGSPTFNRLLDSLRNISLTSGGAKFIDKSIFYQGEFSYDFSNRIKVFDLSVGASFRTYALNSEGTIFALENDDSEVSYTQYGGFVQLKKIFFDNKLHLQASARYDKNPNFEGQFSPRGSAIYIIADKHNIRLSYQRAFRIPTNQEQFIDLDVVTRRLIGTNDLVLDRYGVRTNTVYNTAALQALRDQVFSGAITSDEAANQLQAEERIQQTFRTEKVATYEIGYKSLLAKSKLLIDAYFFLNIYTDYNGLLDVTQAIPNGIRNEPGPFDPNSQTGKQSIINSEVPLQRYGIRYNLDQIINTQGFGLSVQYSFNKGYQLGGNLSYNKFNDDDRNILNSQGFLTDFNTPEWKYNLSVSNREIVKNLGFNVVWRWQEAFLWESSFGVGVIPSYGILDAQVNYKIPAIKVVAKLGASNLLNNRYQTSFGNPTFGAIYFLQLTFDQFLN